MEIIALTIGALAIIGTTATLSIESLRRLIRIYSDRTMKSYPRKSKHSLLDSSLTKTFAGENTSLFKSQLIYRYEPSTFLSGEQHNKLQDALIDAFYNRSLLEQMLDFELDKNLNAIAGEGSLEEIVFKLIRTAESQGWLLDLVRAARKSNPRNSSLQAIAQELFSPPKQEPITGEKPKLQSSPPRQHNDDELSSERNVDYTRLRDLLAAGNWKEADNETYLVMLKAVGRQKDDWIRNEEILNFSCTDLRTINRLWVKYSNGRFGFSVQKEIYFRFSERDGRLYREAWYEFGARVGWRVHKTWIESSEVTDTSAPLGHLPRVGQRNFGRGRHGDEMWFRYLRIMFEMWFNVVRDENFVWFGWMFFLAWWFISYLFNYIPSGSPIVDIMVGFFSIIIGSYIGWWLFRMVMKGMLWFVKELLCRLENMMKKKKREGEMKTITSSLILRIRECNI